MENQQIIIPASDQIVGDITSCKIEKEVFRVDRLSSFSLTEKTTYIAYDVCNKEILSQYTVPELSGLGFILAFCLGIFIVLAGIGIMVGIGSRY